MEKLFSKQDLIEIEKEVSNDLENYIGMYYGGQPDDKRIITVSKYNQLIFVEGNTDTGFQHFSDRHDYFSFKNYWKESEGKKYELDNPSKFHPNTILVDYVKIADAIFKVENKNISRNSRPDTFDKYTRSYNNSDSIIEKYHLITYKDTKIVHTLFPNKKTHNIKSKSRFGKGFVKTQHKFPEGYNDLIVPYQDKEGKVVYSILVRKFYNEKIERLFVQVHDANGNAKEKILLGYREFDNFEEFDREIMTQYQCSHLSDLESIINQINDSRNNI